MREYRSRLSSPSFVLYQSHCLSFEAYISKRFQVKTVHRLEQEKPQIVLLSTTEDLGMAWHKIALTIHIDEEYAGRHMHILFDSYHNGPAIYTAALDNIQLLPGRCEDNTGEQPNC